MTVVTRNVADFMPMGRGSGESLGVLINNERDCLLGSLVARNRTANGFPPATSHILRSIEDKFCVDNSHGCDIRSQNLTKAIGFPSLNAQSVGESKQNQFRANRCLAIYPEVSCMSTG